MKKPFIVLLALLTLFLCACTPAPSPATKAQSQEQTQETLPLSLPLTTQETTEEVPYRNDYFAQLLSRYHPSFSMLSFNINSQFENFKSRWDNGKEEGSLLGILEYFGEPWMVTEKDEEILLHYVPTLLSKDSLQDKDIPNWFFIMEKNGDTLSLKEIQNTEERILVPSPETTVTPETSPQRNNLLSRLIETYCPAFDGSKTYGHGVYTYLELWEYNAVNGTFGEVVDRYGAPWHTWEQDGVIHMEYRFYDTPSFTFIFRPAQDELILEEIRTLYVERDDLTPEMLAQLKVGESTQKEVGTLLGAPQVEYYGSTSVYKYRLVDGRTVKVDYDAAGILEALDVYDPDQKS